LSSTGTPENIVLALLNALNKKDVKSAKSYLSDNVQSTSPNSAPVFGAEKYLEEWKTHGLNYGITKTFADGDEVCVLCDLRFNNPPVTVVGSGFYHVSAGKIDSIKMIFDPRPILSNLRQE
jgi:hypothetical protein